MWRVGGHEGVLWTSPRWVEGGGIRIVSGGILSTRMFLASPLHCRTVSVHHGLHVECRVHLAALLGAWCGRGAGANARVQLAMVWTAAMHMNLAVVWTANARMHLAMVCARSLLDGIKRVAKKVQGGLPIIGLLSRLTSSEGGFDELVRGRACTFAWEYDTLAYLHPCMHACMAFLCWSVIHLCSVHAWQACARACMTRLHA
eukprot:366510-Chlamydomonas_euryale.AAC.6